MFDLAINTTLEPNPIRPNPLLVRRLLLLWEKGVVRFLHLFGEFPNFALLFIRIQTIRFKEKQIVIFSGFLLCAIFRDSRNEGVRFRDLKI
ncbi:hypothetical protein GQ457_01G019470 [Hibiscus cannabinus]